MSNYTIPDGQTVQSQQNGNPGDTYSLLGTSTLVMAGAGIAFASSTGHSTIYDTGITAQPGGYVGDQVVLGAGSATVLVGGIGSTIYGGSGTADLFYSAPATFVTGNENAQVIGNPTGAGISYTGGVHDVQAFNGGSYVHENTGHTITLWAAGLVA